MSLRRIRAARATPDRVDVSRNDADGNVARGSALSISPAGVASPPSDRSESRGSRSIIDSLPPAAAGKPLAADPDHRSFRQNAVVQRVIARQSDGDVELL